MTEPFSTIGGIATKDEAYRKLMHHLDEARNNALAIGHFYRTEDDNMSRLIAKGWYGVDEMLKMMQEQIRQIMMKKVQ